MNVVALQARTPQARLAHRKVAAKAMAEVSEQTLNDDDPGHGALLVAAACIRIAVERRGLNAVEAELVRVLSELRETGA